MVWSTTVINCQRGHHALSCQRDKSRLCPSSWPLASCLFGPPTSGLLLSPLTLEHRSGNILLGSFTTADRSIVCWSHVAWWLSPIVSYGYLATASSLLLRCFASSLLVRLADPASRCCCWYMCGCRYKLRRATRLDCVCASLFVF